MKTWHTVNFVIPIFQSLPVPFMMLNDMPRGPLMVTAVEASSKTKSITNFVDKKSSSVILSETLFSNFVAEHNLPFSLADHFTKSLPKLCK